MAADQFQKAHKNLNSDLDVIVLENPWEHRPQGLRHQACLQMQAMKTTTSNARIQLNLPHPSDAFVPAFCWTMPGV